MEFNFKEFTENVTGTIKKIPPWGWLAIAGGIVVLFLVSRETYSEPGIVSASKSIGSGSAPVGLTGGDHKSMSAGTDGVLSSINDKVTGVVSENKQLATDFNRVSREFESYQTNTNKVLAETEKNFNTLSNAYAFESSVANINPIYGDGRDDADQYSALFSVVSSNSKLDTTQRDRVLDKVAGLGNDGVVDKNAKTSLSLAQIKGDKSALEAEIDRTNRVIENRKEAGLSTANQENWLKQLTPTTPSSGKKTTGDYIPIA